MNSGVKNIMVVIVISLFAISYPTRSYAFPLPTFDVARIAEEVKKIAMAQVMNTWQNIANINVLKEIQHGGFGGAAGALFSNVKSGINGLKGSLYNRFGEEVKNAENSVINFAKEKANREKEKYVAKAKAYAESTTNALLKQKQAEEASDAADAAVEETRKLRVKERVSRAYNWAVRQGTAQAAKTANKTFTWVTDKADDIANSKVNQIQNQITDTTSGALNQVGNSIPNL
jgi:hypothetical protein